MRMKGHKMSSKIRSMPSAGAIKAEKALRTVFKALAGTGIVLMLGAQWDKDDTDKTVSEENRYEAYLRRQGCDTSDLARGGRAKCPDQSSTLE